jgi:hypothetical protein
MVPLLALTRYTEPAQHALVLAEQQALADGDPVISTADMLLGLLCAESWRTSRAWTRTARRMASPGASRLPGCRVEAPGATGALAAGSGAAAPGEEWVAKLAGMRRILLGGVAGILLLAVGTRAADALGIGGPRLRCGCVETCWCKRPGLTVFRWVTPGRWHHICLTADEKRSRHSQT